MPLGVLPASTLSLTEPAGERLAVPAWVRPSLAVAAGLLLVAVLVPPVASEAGRYEFVEAVRFLAFAVVVPALAVLGAPWRWLRLAGPSSSPPADGVAPPAGGQRLFDRIAAGRRRHLGLGRSLAALAGEMGLVVAARTPAVVDALARHAWLVPLEGLCLLAGGCALWLELVQSPPVAPRLACPKRIALAAIAMWTVWVTAYVLGLSHSSMYTAYHLSRVGLSVAADQEITTFVLWFVAATAFVPVVFWNLVAWLRSEEDPDEGLHRLLRESRRTWTVPGDGGGAGRPLRRRPGPTT